MNSDDNKRPEIAKPRMLLICGIIAGPLFVITFLIEGATRVNYDPLRQAVSSLALGEFGWMQVANFIITGLLVLAFAIGLRQLPGSLSSGGVWLIGLVGIGLIGAGLFSPGPLHELFSSFVFLGLASSCFVFGYRFARSGKRGWAFYSFLSAIAMLTFLVLALMGFSQQPSLVDWAGLFQRLSIITSLTWLTSLAIRQLAEPG